MPYTALPDMRMPYDNDGTVVGYGTQNAAGNWYNLGIVGYLSDSDKIELNDYDYNALGAGLIVQNYNSRAVWLFFPEQREITAWNFGSNNENGGWGSGKGLVEMQGSNDTTNGVDGTWESASFTGGYGSTGPGLDMWRANIKAISFTGGKRTIRNRFYSPGGTSANDFQICLFHLYGEKSAGQTPDDVIYINHDDTPGVEYTAPEDFGDRPLGTTLVRQWRVKNVSPTKTANSVNLQCNDSDFAMSEDNLNWVVTINIASLAPGAESATFYIRCTTPAAGNLLGPRFARIVGTVGSWT